MGALYDLIRTDVFAYALSKTKSKHDADDITQDTFVQIFRYAKSYVPKGKPMAWIVTIELNLIRKRFRQQERIDPFEVELEKKPDPTDLAAEVVGNAFLKELLMTLSEREREVVALRVVWGLKHREIARALGSPLATVLSQYNRAVQKLKRTVKEKQL